MLIANCFEQREQMFEAQELFRMAPKLTRPEKALIIGFIAGNRENPYPEQGDVIQVSSYCSNFCYQKQNARKIKKLR